MKIFLNENIIDIPDNSSMSDLIKIKGLSGRKNIVVTINGTVLDKECLSSTKLSENDDVKIYTFVQGG
ncbi:MAG TPA: sulfur carrier protein ThiS [Victivallales bacterium]|nr:sulfur carrier protein ThiS [Victivallales bacterium]